MSKRVTRHKHPAFQEGSFIAFCYRSGQIGFIEHGPIPEGALMLARGPQDIVASSIHGLARLAYDNETWLVPGIPEAANDDQAFEAMMTFIDRVASSISRRVVGR